MKIGGVVPSGPTEEVLVLPRANGDVVFKARAVLDMSEFDALCPLPKAPGILTKDGFRSNTEAPSYKQLIKRHSELKMGYMIVKSLLDIEWDTVTDDPNSWPNWEKDLEAAGFNSIEVQRILVCCLQANSLDESKLKAARDSFLAGAAKLEKFSGQDSEQESTQSGEAASDSA